MAVGIRFVRLQDKRLLTLPADLRDRLGLQKGDYVAIEKTADGLLITAPQAASAFAALDKMGAALRERGVTLGDWMERGREIREELYREKYGHLEIEAP